jgi:hypothetical protein
MTEGTGKKGLQVARLDRSKLRGYDLVEHARDISGTPARFTWANGDAHGDPREARALAIADIWAHCEAENDPPGMDLLPRVIDYDAESEPAQAGRPTRAEAWSMYWRRVDLVRRMEALSDPRYRLQAPAAWPEVLTWSDEQVAQVEKDLAEAESFQSRKATERPRDRDGRGQPLDPDADYYVQEADGSASGLVGNCMRFWREGGRGYTCQLGEAGVYKGRVCLTMRPTDVPWPVEFIRTHAVLHVRMDMLPKAGA